MSEKQSAKGKGYDNPKHWGDPAEASDIFQVSEADVKENGSYILGDFYVAQKSGSYGYFPYFGDNTDSWKHAWSGCGATPQIVTPSLGSTVTLYANGLHCAAIVFWFTPEDATGNTITNLPSGYFQEVPQKYGKLFQLTEYTGGLLSNGWASLSTPTPYTAMISETQQQGGTPSGTHSLTLYVTSETQTDLQLGIQVTAADGTVTSFGSNGISIDPVTVKTISPFTYDMSRCTGNDDTSHNIALGSYRNQYFGPSDTNFRFIKSEKISGGIYEDWYHVMDQYQPSNEMAQINQRNFLYSTCTMQYYWDISPGASSENLGCNYTVPATINDRPGYLTVTTTLETALNPEANLVSTSVCVFKVYDQYGNQGKFQFQIVDKGTGHTALFENSQQ